MMLIAWLLSAALAVGSVAQEPSVEGWAQCEEDGPTRRLGPTGPVTSVLRLYGGADGSAPPLLPGLQPMTITATDIDYMRALNLESLDVMMSGKPAYTPGFGAAEPGVYTVRLAPIEDPGCASYVASVARSKSLGVTGNFDFAPVGHCVTLTPTELDLSAYSHLIVTYSDGAASRRGYFRSVTELRRADGETVARATKYAFETGRSRTCPQNLNTLSLSDFLLESK